MERHTEIKIFTGSESVKFAQGICEYLNIPMGKSQVIKFSEGNTFVKVEETVRDKDCYIVQSIGSNPNDNLVELLFWIDAFKRASANSITVIMPYFSYAKGDKKDEPRVSIRARVCADALESVGADRIVTMDLHAPQIQGFFKIPVDHLFAMPVLCSHFKQLGVQDLVVVSPDAGYAKTARHYSNFLQVPVAIGDKNRKDHSEQAEILEIIGDVKGKNALIVDDFTLSAGSIINVAKGLKEKGAKDIYACVSHSLLKGETLEKFYNSPIKKMLVTDSVTQPQNIDKDRIEVCSVAPLFAEAIKRIHHRESVTELFDKIPDSVI
ncbi:ribose-phosphate pyrophosphokinase [Alkalicella caledoniensis]|uniref:ribose-phosphate diphosphokinase n=1 Tax=Alkalicella caledoniensis TaxID=2731377 RepID=A0A7G9W559_ALKCA|nr:ribose-phosphate pyrophosphokinase [Alkalicella caledoniensis]QNO13821.1 ribose-phosphate pyrophosphokinase [Alkalicella caledoniensis]